MILCHDNQGKVLAEVRCWADRRLADGYSRQAVVSLILNEELNLKDPACLARFVAFSRVERELAAVMVDRNRRGKMMEREGEIDEAVTLYEANLADQFVGSHPYERLRIIYSERGDFVNALRVCEAAISNPFFGDMEGFVEWREWYRLRL